MKYLEKQIVFREVPLEVSLSYLITGCPQRCQGCHSSDSWNAHKGEELTEIKLKDDLRKFQRGITCVLFMGGDWDVLALNRLLLVVKDFGLKTALYSGADDVHSDLKSNLDYIKLGSYQKQLGGLESLETNQVLWHWPSQTKLNFYFTQHLQGGRNDQAQRSSITK